MGTLVTIVVWFCVGVAVPILLTLIVKKEVVFDTARRLQPLIDQIAEYRRERKKLKAELHDLKQAKTRLTNERKRMAVAWRETVIDLVDTKCVDASKAVVFGRGEEWVYAYTFPTHESLAASTNESRYPIKVGMSTQADVVKRVHQQVSGSSTAISERAIVRLVFRVRDSRALEKFMHNHFKRAGQEVDGSVGVEWFRTNPGEIEQLFRSYILTKDDRPPPPEDN